MTNEKAKEYFSAYSEGTLDAGLAQSFEAKLKADSNLRAEYEQFEATLKELEALRFEQIEVPFDLNDKIGAAIDKSIYDNKRSTQPGWTLWLRNLAFGGLAAAAIVGAVLSIKAGTSHGPAVSGTGIGNTPKPVVQPIEQIQYKASPNGVMMSYRPSEKHSVTIRGGSNGQEVIDVDQAGWDNVLKNAQVTSATFVVEVKGEVPSAIVIVPGSERKDTAEGQGSVTELAKAIADKYGIPVVVKSSRAESQISWNLVDTDAHKATQSALQNMPFTPYLQDGVLLISDN